MNFKDIWRKYFNNSYGWDELSTFLVLCSLIFLPGTRYGKFVSAVLIVIALWRCFSKDRYRRYGEKEAFFRFISSFRYKITHLFSSTKDSVHYKVISCPRCGQKLRVPRHQGKIIITCKKCHNEFKAKS